MKFSFLITLIIAISLSCKSDTSINAKHQNQNNDSLKNEEVLQEQLDPEQTTSPDAVKEKTTQIINNEQVQEIKQELIEEQEIIKEQESEQIVVAPGPETKPKSVPKPEEKAKQDNIGQVQVEKVPVETNSSIDEYSDHVIFDRLLQKYVDLKGAVNYTGLGTEINDFNTYINILYDVNIDFLKKDERLAFWMNAYNAFTIKKILDNYPLKSITDLDKGKPWDVADINLAGMIYSLNQIENDIIRPRFKDARIHFALNCAAKSCPPIMNNAWTAENLNERLNKQTKLFINNPVYNIISKDKIKVSKIFEWYAEDFGDLISFLNKYSTVKIDSDAAVEYTDYDWRLNH